MEPTLSTATFAVVFERAAAARLDSAERLVLSLPALFPGSLVECDLAFQERSAILALVMRFGAGFDAAARQRLDFWCARAGVRATSLERLAEAQRAVFAANVGRCELKRLAVPAARLADEARALFTEAGAPADRAATAPARATLAVDVGGPGWAGVRFEPAERILFVPGVLAPPVGDELDLALRFHGADRPRLVGARVVGARAADHARAGAPAGFTLLVDDARDVIEALAAEAVPPATLAAVEHRAHPRYAVKSPAVVAPRTGEPSEAEVVAAVEGADGGAAEPAAAVIEYATDEELAQDFVENLSQGGAFVRTERAAPVGSRIALTMRLPCGDELVTSAVVAMANEKGMGVRFELDEAGEARLAAAIAHISARPRRALLVEDDELVRRMLQEALRQRGFEVLTASDGTAGLSTLADELLALDLLITDVRMPGMDGESLIRTIRCAGGESDLAIVVVTGALEPGLEPRLELEGADAVLDKALGPELIAQAADAVLERKRRARA
jgi:CheY-like chemotaxis protein